MIHRYSEAYGKDPYPSVGRKRSLGLGNFYRLHHFVHHALKRIVMFSHVFEYLVIHSEQDSLKRINHSSSIINIDQDTYDSIINPRFDSTSQVTITASFIIHSLTSPKASVLPKIPPEALAISPWNILTSSNVITTSFAPRYEWIRDLL